VAYFSQTVESRIFFCDKLTTSSDHLVLFTDAASTLGFGDTSREDGLVAIAHLSYIMDSEMPMAFRELYPIFVAAVLWSKY
jgi:hypothetical protein